MGSCRGPQSFKRGDTVFHRDDIPADRQARAAEVRRWKAKATAKVGISRPNWNPSAHYEPPRLRVRVVSEGNPLAAFQYNYRAEVLPAKPPPLLSKCKSNLKLNTTTKSMEMELTRKREEYMSGAILHPKRTQEMPVHPQLANSKPWNSSTEVLLKDLDARRDSITRNAKDYMRRRARTASYTEGVRRSRSSQFAKSQQQEKHASSGETMDELQRKEAYNHLAKTAVSRYKVRFHSGIFEYREAEGRHMWSDTGSYEPSGAGDCIRIRNPWALNIGI